jgi:phage replication-related protein YjqB (UPF0714/DUF867 family)
LVLPDLYANFAELAGKESLGTDYQICLKDCGTPTVVIAPHEGCIEPGTSEVTKSIAGDDLSYYVFEGLRDRPHGDLHITSSRFDEPMGLQLIAGAEIVIAIHGRADAGDPKTTSFGGRNSALGHAVASCLKEAGFPVAAASYELSGRDPANICNRGSSGAGVQLELPRTLRDALIRDEAKLRSFSDAVRIAIFA